MPINLRTKTNYQPHPFYTTADPKVNRNHHVWLLYDPKAHGRAGAKCVLCGAIAEGTPPAIADEEEFSPERYEPLTEAERKCCPPHNGLKR